MKIILTLPILIPFVTGIILILLWNYRSWQRILSVLGNVALLAVGFALLADVWQNGIQAVQIGNWPAPFGITLVADLLTCIMVILAGLMGVSVGLYSLSSMDEQRIAELGCLQVGHLGQRPRIAVEDAKSIVRTAKH